MSILVLSLLNVPYLGSFASTAIGQELAPSGARQAGRGAMISAPSQRAMIDVPSILVLRLLCDGKTASEGY